MVSINSVKIGFLATKVIVWNTYNTYKFLEAVLYQLHKYICTYLIQNKKENRSSFNPVSAIHSEIEQEIFSKSTIHFISN